MAKRKKKNQITLISLLLALVLLTGFYVWYMNRDKFGGSGNLADEDSESDEEASLIIADMDLDLVNTIYYKNENADMTFVLEDERWKLEADKNRPINQDYIRNMLNLVDQVKADRLVHENPEDLEQYGLLEPYASLELVQSDGNGVKLSLGNEISGGQGYYAKIEGNDAVYILPNIYKTHLSHSDAQMTYVEDGPSITSNNIYHIEVLQRDGEDFELIYDPDSKYHKVGNPMLAWAILKPYEEVYSADSSKVSEILDNFDSFDFLTSIEYQTEEFDKYGLEEPSASVLVDYYEQYTKPLEEPVTDSDTGEEITEETITEEKSIKIYIGDKDDSGDYYVRKDGDKAVYTMKATSIDGMLNVDAFSIFSPFISIHNIDTVDRIDIDISGKSYTMEIKRETIVNEDDEEEVKESYYYNGILVEEDVFKDVYQDIIGAKYDTQLKEPASAEGLELILTISYHLNTGETYSTNYYPYDDSFYLVDNGNVIRFTTDKRNIDGIIKSVHELGRAED